MPHSGTTDDFTSVMAALEGAYGAFVNTDSFTIGEAKEIYTGMRIFELAKQIGTLKHYVWSGLDYSYKVFSHVHGSVTQLTCLYSAERWIQPYLSLRASRREGPCQRLDARSAVRREREQHVLEYPLDNGLHGDVADRAFLFYSPRVSMLTSAFL